MTHGPLGPFDDDGPRDARGPQDSVRGRPGSGFPGPAGSQRPDEYDAGGYGPGYGGGGRGRFNAFPFPSYTTRTRGGTQVSVGGCCLPLPIGCLMLTLGAGGLAAARFVQSRR